MNAIRGLAIGAMIAAFMLGGCSGEDSGGSTEPADAAGQNRELLNAVKQPLDRAHEVEDISAARKGELDREIESAQ